MTLLIKDFVKKYLALAFLFSKSVMSTTFSQYYELALLKYILFFSYIYWQLTPHPTQPISLFFFFFSFFSFRFSLATRANPRDVHQTAPKPPAKWHNRTTSQVIVHRTAPHRMVQCNLWFYNKKTVQTALHCTLSIY